MTKAQLEILQECEKAGIRDKNATFYSFDDNVFTYELEIEDGSLLHAFILCGDVVLFREMKVEDIISLKGMTYLKYSVVLDGDVIETNTAHIDEEVSNG